MDLNIKYTKVALFWVAMVVTIATTMVMIYKGVPFYVYNEVSGGIPISPWWLLNGLEMPVVVTFFPAQTVANYQHQPACYGCILSGT